MSEINVGNNFEKASRLKLRFDTKVGPISVEDLWDLPLTSRTNRVNLDDIARGLYRQVKESGDEVSFVTPAQKPDERIQLAFDLVKYVISIRVAERDAAAEVALKKEKKQRLLELIAKKDDEELAGKSREDLLAMVEAL